MPLRYFCTTFLVGDDPMLAVIVVLGLAATAAIASWWMLPIAVIGGLSLSLLRNVS